MLRELRINNMAIIDQMSLTFGAGLNVLTGETGAGKSIITRAIGLLCGGRASADLIRTEADEAEIEGVFDLDAAARARLADLGLTDDDEVAIRRVIARKGKGRIHINGSAATATVLGQLGESLIHLYGQHDYALLLKPESHLAFLDQFGGLEARCADMANAYATYRDARDRLAGARSGIANREERIEFLRFQLDELDKLAPVTGDEDALRGERERQRHADKIGRACQEAEVALSSGDQAISGVLHRIAAIVDEAAQLDRDLSAPASTLREALAQVDDVALDLRRIGDRVEQDPERLEQIEQRLADYARLKRKHGREADELVTLQESLQRELDLLTDADASLEDLEAEVQTAGAAAWEIAQAITSARKAAAEELSTRLVQEAANLGMTGSVFRVVFHEDAEGAPAPERLSAAGGDVVEFYLSANPGEEARPLAKIASGGELSRIMLGLKALTAGAGEVGTLIFDEVDTGIGGETAEAVGERLRRLGRNRQLLSITHLPQIAAMADHHVAIAKQVRKGRTITEGRVLEQSERVTELARMLGAAGDKESERYARKLMASKRRSP